MGSTCPTISPRLWVYTNFDCNLQCSYCVARSHPRAERRGISRMQLERLVDEAADFGIEQLFLTGGEPFLLPLPVGVETLRFHDLDSDGQPDAVGLDGGNLVVRLAESFVG